MTLETFGDIKYDMEGVAERTREGEMNAITGGGR